MANLYTKLANQAVETYVKSNKTISVPLKLPAEFRKEKSGVFVTLESGQQQKLRGCIGTFLPTKDSVAAEIIANAIAAATEDYRFGPITPEELPDLYYTVSLLQEPQQIKTIKDLNVKEFGVIVKTDDGRTGLLLPDIDSIDTVEKQVSVAAQKGGIDLAKDNIYLFRFQVAKYTDEK